MKIVMESQPVSRPASDLTPCWRAAAAWGLGEIGDKCAIPELLKVAGDFDNTTDTRHAAAVSLGKLADASTRTAVRELAEGYPEVSTRETLIKGALEDSASLSSRRRCTRRPSTHSWKAKP